jgi:hypothetical protein
MAWPCVWRSAGPPGVGVRDSERKRRSVRLGRERWRLPVYKPAGGGSRSGCWLGARRENESWARAWGDIGAGRWGRVCASRSRPGNAMAAPAAGRRRGPPRARCGLRLGTHSVE